jgi:hypothetical protein
VLIIYKDKFVQRLASLLFGSWVEGFEVFSLTRCIMKYMGTYISTGMRLSDVFLNTRYIQSEA